MAYYCFSSVFVLYTSHNYYNNSQRLIFIEFRDILQYTQIAKLGCSFNSRNIKQRSFSECASELRKGTVCSYSVAKIKA